MLIHSAHTTHIQHSSGLSVPTAPELEGVPLDDGVKRGYTALRQPWRPDTSSGVAAKYGKRVERRIGKADEDAKRLGSGKGGGK